MSAVPAAAALLPAADDPADALARAELAAPSGSGAGWRSGDPDPLRDGLLVGYADAPRLRRLAAFVADPETATRGWRLATLIRAAGAEVALIGDLVHPRGFGRLPPFLAAEARGRRHALARWLRLEADTPAELRPHARPPFGAAEALAEGADFCAACGPPPPGAVSLWWAGPGSREWRCATCAEPPDDDRVAFAYGRSGDDPAPAGRAPGGGEHAPRAEGADT